MAHPIHEADTVSSPTILQPPAANVLRSERDHLQALRRRLDAAAEALTRVRDHLQTRASRGQGGDKAGALDPDGGRQ